MIIRRELPDDAEPLRTLFAAVLSEDLFDKLHADEDWLSSMSFVALGGDDQVLGHVAATGGRVESSPVLTLVPPSVDASHRGQGVGQALMNAVLGAAEAREEPLIGAVAMPTEFLTRFGFHPGEKFSIAPSVGGWTPYFLVRPLTGYTDSLRGIFYFPKAFGT